MGSGPPACAMTTPICPAGICTIGWRETVNTGQNLKRRPGIRSCAWYPASPAKATGLPPVRRLKLKRLRTSPTEVGPMVQNDCHTTNSAPATRIQLSQLLPVSPNKADRKVILSPFYPALHVGSFFRRETNASAQSRFYGFRKTTIRAPHTAIGENMGRVATENK